MIVPKSTLDNWAREFERWVPGFDVVLLKGGKEERVSTINKTLDRTCLTHSLEFLGGGGAAKNLAPNLRHHRHFLRALSSREISPQESRLGIHYHR